MFSKARITAIGSYVPEKRLTNFDLEKIVDTSDQWIVERTGMRERRITEKNEFSSHLSINAVQQLMDNYNKSVEDVDFIIVATTTPDYPFPSVACLVQDYFKINSTGAIDLNAACAGFAYGLELANSLITSGGHKKILVIGAETLSKVTDYTDRASCILFGDGAGAVLVERDENFSGFIASHSGSKGEGGQHLYRIGLSNTLGDMPMLGEGNMVQNGREVYKWAVRTVPEGMNKLLKKANLTINNLDWFVPHSANLRMIESITEKLELDRTKLLHSVEYYGNTSSASIPLSLDLAVKEGKLKYNDTLAIYGFGGGLTHSGLIVKWGIQ